MNLRLWVQIPLGAGLSLFSFFLCHGRVPLNRFLMDSSIRQASIGKVSIGQASVSQVRRLVKYVDSSSREGMRRFVK